MKRQNQNHDCPYCGHAVTVRRTKDDLYCANCMVSWPNVAALNDDAWDANTQPDVIYRQHPDEVKPRWN